MTYTHVCKHAGGVCADGGHVVEAQNTNQLVDVSKTFYCQVQNKTEFIFLSTEEGKGHNRNIWILL